MPRRPTTSRARRGGSTPSAGGATERRDDEPAALGLPAQERELRARGRRTMRRLLDAGAEVFAKRGFHAARVDDVVKLAKTSHGTFYLYFANKEDLFRALALDVAGEMTRLVERFPAVDANAAGYRELRAWLDEFVACYERYGAVIRAWTEAEIGSSEFGRLGTDVLGEFTRVLADRVGAAAPAHVDPQVAALAAVAMIERLNYYVEARQVDVTRDQVVDTLAQVVHAGLFGARRRRTRR